MSNVYTKNTELLAPAGSYDAFIASINAGADAVYMGLERFNARIMTNHFTTEEYFTLKLLCYSGSASGTEWNYYYFSYFK